MKKVIYRKKTASLPQKTLKKAKSSYKKAVAPALKSDNLRLRAFQYSALFLFLLCIFSATLGVLMYINFTEKRERRAQVENDLKYWEDVILEHPNFPDGYYNAGIYAGTLGQKDKALDYLEKAIVLDPEFLEAAELAQKIREE